MAREIRCDRCGDTTDKDYTSIDAVKVPSIGGADRLVQISGLVVSNEKGDLMVDLCRGCAQAAIGEYLKRLDV